MATARSCATSEEVGRLLVRGWIGGGVDVSDVLIVDDPVWLMGGGRWSWRGERGGMAIQRIVRFAAVGRGAGRSHRPSLLVIPYNCALSQPIRHARTWKWKHAQYGHLVRAPRVGCLCVVGDASGYN